MDNLPALMGGQVPPHERRAAVLRPAVVVAAGLSAVLMGLGLVLGLLSGLGEGPAGWVGGFGFVLFTALGLFSAGNVFGDLKLLQAHPDLGRRQGRWELAGATSHQLRILNEAHRVDRLNPPVGYGDRRTLINPLGDAYAIFTSPAWRDSWLADRKLQIDPVVEAAEIIAFVHQVTGLLREVGEQIRISVPGSPAQRTFLGFERTLLGSLDDGLRRARALTAYRAEVSRLELLLADQQAVPQIEAFAERVLDVASESARQDLATLQIEDGRDQLQMLESSLREITELMRQSHHPHLTDG